MIRRASLPSEVRPARSTSAASLWALAIFAIAALFTGCSWLPAPRLALDAEAGFYDAAKLTYRLDAGRLNVPLAVSRIQSQLVSYDQLPSAPLPDRSVGTLTIVFPHPDGRAALAQACVEITSQGQPAEASKPWWKRAASSQKAAPPANQIREVWALDISKADFDLTINALRKENYFESQPRSTPGAALSVRMNNRVVEKPWDQVARLDELMQRVRREGQLVAYQRPATLPEGTQLTSSLAAYRNLVVERGLPSANPTPTLPPAIASSGLSAPLPPAAVQIARLPGAVR